MSKKKEAPALPAELSAAAEEAGRFLASLRSLAALEPYLKDLASMHQAAGETSARRDAALREVAEAEVARDAVKAGADDLVAAAEATRKRAEQEAAVILENARNRESAITREAVEQRDAVLAERDRQAEQLGALVAERKASLVDLEASIDAATAHLNELREQGRKLAGSALESFGG
ncbi:hypothetical protein UFOVP821_33 [uncultured Caudovirales phage]|uniref:Uncharacterized protein n=1 Tax=uncultured Caudovirales phage TaxID=2100421 RepID=A0A6J5P883_9CAUD|nr:hypothetical protein UFOVP821_33 [uncultured Caudovirales phage]